MADGTRASSLGNPNWEIVHGGLRRIIEVPEEMMAEGLRTLYTKANLKVEPALTVGAMLTQPQEFAGKRVCLHQERRGNVDVDVYVKVLAGSDRGRWTTDEA